MPGSLAIIEASFASDDRGRAIGAWTGLGGVATAVGPLVGGWLVTASSWRLIFVLNLPLAVAVLWASRHVPESTDAGSDRRVDLVGAVALVVGLAGATYALIEAPAPAQRGGVVLAAVLGVLGLVAFFVAERRSPSPMVPLGIFRSREFSVSNVVTLLVYAALGGVLFLLVVDLQEVLGYTALAAGAALLPLTAIMLTLSARAGRLSSRIGPKIPMTVGPLVIAVGLLLMRRIEADSDYLNDVLPAIVVFGLGLSLTVAPLTTTVLGALEDRYAGVASGVNNAVARLGGLLAVALLPPLAGITGAAYREPVRLSTGFHTAVTIAAGLCVIGAVTAAVGLPARRRARREAHPPAVSCALDAPGLRGTPVPPAH